MPLSQRKGIVTLGPEIRTEFFLELAFSFDRFECSRLPLNGHLYQSDDPVKRTPRVGSCLSLLPLFNFLSDRHLSKTHGHLGPVPMVRLRGS